MNEGDSVVVGTVCNVHNLLSYGVIHISTVLVFCFFGSE